MACLLAVAAGVPFGGWCNAQTQSSVGHGSSPAWGTSFK